MFLISITLIAELALYINNKHNLFRIIINLKDIGATYDIIVMFMTVENKYTVRHRNKFLSLVLFLILIIEILMVDAHFKPLIGHNPFVSIMPMLDISLRDFLFSHNYLDAFNIILGYFTAKSF